MLKISNKRNINLNKIIYSNDSTDSIVTKIMECFDVQINISHEVTLAPCASYLRDVYAAPRREVGERVANAGAHKHKADAPICQSVGRRCARRFCPNRGGTGKQKDVGGVLRLCVFCLKLSAHFLYLFVGGELVLRRFFFLPGEGNHVAHALERFGTSHAGRCERHEACGLPV